jgi:hypothetical protein
MRKGLGLVLALFLGGQLSMASITPIHQQM